MGFLSWCHSQDQLVVISDQEAATATLDSDLQEEEEARSEQQQQPLEE